MATSHDLDVDELKDVITRRAKITKAGQATVPKDIRDIIGVGLKDEVEFVCLDGETVYLVNPNADE